MINQLTTLYTEARAILPHNLAAIAIEEVDRFGFQESMSGRDARMDTEAVEYFIDVLHAALSDDVGRFEDLIGR